MKTIITSKIYILIALIILVLLSFYSSMLYPLAGAFSGLTWTEQPVTTSFDGAAGVFLANVDGDSDLDIVAAAENLDEIRWWENNNGTFTTSHSVAIQFFGAHTVYAVDIDGNETMDVIAAGSDSIDLWQNTDGSGTDWSRYFLTSILPTNDLDVADIDGNLELDIVGAGDQGINWWQNQSGDFSQQFVPIQQTSFDTVESIVAVNLDGDTDLDLLAILTVSAQESLFWWENTLGDGSEWAQHTITSSYPLGRDVYPIDLNGIGGQDFVSASAEAGISLWQNSANDGSTWEEMVISSDFAGASQVYAIDMDTDEDLDIVAVAEDANQITWWENSAGSFTEHPIDTFNGAWRVHAGNIDADNDIDIVAASFLSDTISWWQQEELPTVTPTNTATPTNTPTSTNTPTAGPSPTPTITPTPPTVLQILDTEPAGNSSNVALESDLNATFNGALDTSSVDMGTFTIRGEQTGLYLGSYSFPLGNEVRFEPDGTFKAGELIVTTANSAIQATNEVPLVPYTWQFWTNVLGGNGLFTDSQQRLGQFISEDVAFGDVDNDGSLDAVVANDVSANQVWLNDGTGSFSDNLQLLTRRPLAEGEPSSRGVALADLDSDGALDAFFAIWGSNEVWLNDGAGNFSQLAQPFGSTISNDVALGDIDGDGDLDAFVANFGTNQVWWNDGAANFSDSEQFLGLSDSQAVALGDVDGDGDLDAFVANLNQPNTVWLNEDGGFFIDSEQALGDFSSRDVALADLDADGDLDAFVANQGDEDKVWLNDGLGNFTDSGQALGSSASHGVALGDVDADDDLDAFIANRGNEGNLVWLNDGNGSFADNGQSLGNASSHAVVLGDTDADGDLDAFVANEGANYVWLNGETASGNQAPTMPNNPTPADNATDAAISQQLSWQGGDPDNDSVTYNVAFGTTSPPPEVATNLTNTAYDPGLLAANSTYHWSITASDGISTTIGDIWSFTTTALVPEIFTIGPEGGTFVSEGGRVIIEFPAGSVTESTDFTYTPEDSPLPLFAPAEGLGVRAAGLDFAGVAFDLAASRDGTALPDFSFEVPIEITARYSDAEISGLNEGLIDLRYWDGSAWVPLPQLLQDPGRNRVTANSTFTAEFATFAPQGCLAANNLVIVGPTEGYRGVKYTFTAVVSPTAASLPMLFNWTPAPQSGQGTVRATYSWDSNGTFDLGVEAINCAAEVNNDTSITISDPPVPPEGDAYESNDTCSEAKAIPTTGNPQVHSFHDAGDPDWVSFEAEAGTTYIIDALIPPTSSADVILELFDECEGSTLGGQDHTFSDDVRLIYQTPTSGNYYLRLSNHDSDIYGATVDYHLSIDVAESEPKGALVLVAGKLNENDALQENIHNLTNSVYQLALENGCTPNDIYYLANDTSMPGVDDDMSAASLEFAITEWAADRVGKAKRFTFYGVDHGSPDLFYLDGAGETLTPAQFDGWLSNLEAQVPDLESNIIMEACYSGSFIAPEQEISQEGRLVISSTSADELAYATTEGAIFSDKLINTLSQGESLYTSFQQSRWTAQQAHPDQKPWFDADGDGIPNELEDTSIALTHGFACSAAPNTDNWAPNISDIEVQLLSDGNLGIWANVQDDKDATGRGVRQAWVVVYPPDYQPPSESEQLVNEEQYLERPPLAMIATNASNLYGSLYPALTQNGSYRVVVHAIDEEGFVAQPQELELQNGEVGYQLHLPLILR